MISAVQADMVLLLVTLVCGGSNAAIRHHLEITTNIHVKEQVRDDRLLSHLLTPPESHHVREKVRVGYTCTW